MKDERYWPVLGTWLKDTAEAPPDPRLTVRKVAERLPDTPQLRRRWWLPSLRRTPTLPHGRDGTTGHQPVPISITTDRFASATGRTRTMFSPVKAIAAGAIVALFGGFLLAGILSTPQDGDVLPAAVPEALSPMSTEDLSAPHHVTVIFTWAELAEPGEESEDGLSVRGDAWLGWVHSPEDPRLTGTARIALNVDGYQAGMYVTQSSLAIRIDNDDGAWVGTMRGYRDPETKPQRHLNIELNGEGGYAGHAAVLSTPGSTDSLWEGFVFPSPLLEYPDPIEPPAG